MNVLVLGGGGREHALCRALSKSQQLTELFAIPGNPGIAKLAQCHSLDVNDHKVLKSFCERHHIQLIIPGSEVYLANGIADVFEDLDVFVFGPNKKAAKLESSKTFAKDLMTKYNIPTANYEKFNEYSSALTYLLKKDAPYVIKYTGLAQGKGVVVTSDINEAKTTLKTMLVDHKFGHDTVIIEDYLAGIEFSFMAFVHDHLVIPMPICQDYKPAYDHDLGPNTGGMGAISPVDTITQKTIDTAYHSILKKTVSALSSEGLSYTGFLYGGFIQTDDGPKVIEFNVRFGDPEAEVLLEKLDSDLLDIILSLKVHQNPDIKWHDGYYLGVVLASKGYPKKYQRGAIIEGLKQLKIPYYHMGTTLDNTVLKTNSGRVLIVVGHGKTYSDALTLTYQEITKIYCENLRFRTDIGFHSQKGVNNG